ncbi:MAG TPA: SAM-dependent chlorinase/fluorinase, partial [Candidatus Edwardsbacteria bacterium]|nr:SAM-dependent chlorinase/fluorinase [Candidatus Edwardsbacteria bacterium]
MPEHKIVTLTTDFGLRDFYVGALKGAMLSINPELQIIDVTHGIAGHDVLGAAFIIKGFYRCFPKGTVHVAVVDPGVGGARRPILVETKDYYFVGPDNGIFSYVYQLESSFRAVHLTASQHFAPDVGDTFHGRDIFGPVAAHLLDGLDARWLGQEVTDVVRLPLPETRTAGNRIGGQVVYVDRFGNLVTNIEQTQIA